MSRELRIELLKNMKDMSGQLGTYPENPILDETATALSEIHERAADGTVKTSLPEIRSEVVRILIDLPWTFNQIDVISQLTKRALETVLMHERYCCKQ